MRYLKSFGVAIGLFALAAPAHAKQCDWRIKGTFKVEHELQEMADKFGDKQALKNIQVKVSAKTGSALPWGSWGTVRTNSNGAFTLSNRKSCADRYFKIEVQFKDNEVELRHETATSSFNKVKSYEAWNSANFGNKKPPTVVDVGTLVFGPGAGVSGKHQRGEFQVYRHAQMWTVFKMMNDVLEGYGPEYDFERTLVFKYPHNSWVAGSAEASYLNPITNVGYIHKDGNTDEFRMDVLLHEAFHAWAYDKFDGEGCLTWDLVLTHDTHDLAPTSCSAFNEGFAKAAQERFEHEQFGEAMGLPHNRARLSSGAYPLSDPVPRPALVERLDEGWYSIFMAMMNENLGRLKFGTAADTPDDARNGHVVGTCSQPKVTLKRLLKVFLANGDKGFFRDLHEDETRMEPFLARAAAILDHFDEEHADAIAAAHNSRLTSEPSDFMCESAVVQQKAPGRINTSVPVSSITRP